MNRAEAVTYLADRVGEYLSAAGRDATDAPGKTLRPIIDDALRAMEGDFLTSGVVTDTEQVIDYQAYLVYIALLQLSRDLGATMINYSGGGRSYSLQAIRQAVKEDLDRATIALEKRVGGGLGWIDMGFLAPIPEARLI